MKRVITALLLIFAVLQYTARGIKSYWLNNGEELTKKLQDTARRVKDAIVIAYELGADARVAFEAHWPTFRHQLVVLGMMLPPLKGLDKAYSGLVC